MKTERGEIVSKINGVKDEVAKRRRCSSEALTMQHREKCNGVSPIFAFKMHFSFSIRSGFFFVWALLGQTALRKSRKYFSVTPLPNIQNNS